MKTKAEFFAAKKTFEKRMTRRLIALFVFLVLVIALRYVPGWLPRGAFAWMPVWLGIVFFGFIPFVIIHQLTRGITDSARACGLVCPSCGKEIFKQGTKLDVTLAANECPCCGHALYTT